MYLIAWVEFKIILRKNLGDFKAFVNIIWSKVKRDPQYQLEEVQDWASYLEHFQFILPEFNANGVLAESFMIQFFWEKLKLLVRAQIKQRDWESDSWKDLVKKTVNTKAKAGLLPISLIRDMDQRALCSNLSIYTTAKTQT